MSIWLELRGVDVGVSDGFLFGVIGARLRKCKLNKYTSDDSLEEMNKLGWGLIAPATFSKWSD